MHLPGRLSWCSPVELAPRCRQRLGVRLRIAPVHPGCREQVKQEDEGVASLVTRPEVWPFLTALRGLPWGRGGVRVGALQLKFKCLSSRPALPLSEPHDLSMCGDLVKEGSHRMLIISIHVFMCIVHFINNSGCKEMMTQETLGINIPKLSCLSTISQHLSCVLGAILSGHSRKCFLCCA